MSSLNEANILIFPSIYSRCKWIWLLWLLVKSENYLMREFDFGRDVIIWKPLNWLLKFIKPMALNNIRSFTLEKLKRLNHIHRATVESRCVYQMGILCSQFQSFLFIYQFNDGFTQMRGKYKYVLGTGIPFRLTLSE